MTKNNKLRFALDVYSNLTGIVRFAVTVPVLTLLGISAFLLISNFKTFSIILAILITITVIVPAAIVVVKRMVRYIEYDIQGAILWVKTNKHYSDITTDKRFIELSNTLHKDGLSDVADAMSDLGSWVHFINDPEVYDKIVGSKDVTLYCTQRSKKWSAYIKDYKEGTSYTCEAE